ncbi:hypothetical protein Tsubulata_018284 [Turnera subulata]|uniref:Uncharacterized protein n=1 Tax=Turnera subulata TaxID=218843 RepID=A0A9Q0JKG1_9ROSI|nr:hypothetical protein Tsubulata_018284 [Turnera subulata]
MPEKWLLLISNNEGENSAGDICPSKLLFDSLRSHKEEPNEGNNSSNVTREVVFREVKELKPSQIADFSRNGTVETIL